MTPQQRYYQRNKELCRARSLASDKRNPKRRKLRDIRYREKLKANTIRYTEYLKQRKHTYRKYNVAKHGKMTLEQYDHLLYRQNFRCRICVVPFGNHPQNRAVIDHNHVSGKVRGLLCNKCNLALGLFADNIAYFENAIHYLKEVTV